MRGVFSCILIIAITLSSGCVFLKKPKAPPLSEDPHKLPAQICAECAARQKSDIPPQQQQSEMQQYQDADIPQFIKPPVEKHASKTEPIDTKRVVHAVGDVMLNTEAMPLSDFIVYAVGNTLKVTFFLDDLVKSRKDPITIRMTKALPPETVFEIVLGLLERHNVVVEEKAGALYIIDSTSKLQGKKPIEILVGSEVSDSHDKVLQIVPLKYIRSADIENIIRPMGTEAQIVTYYRDNVMLISGKAFAISEIMELIELFDVPYIKNKKLALLKLTYWQTDEFVTQISKILDGVGITVANSRIDPGVFFIPIKFLNSILVITPDAESLQYVFDWHKKLDTHESAGAEEKTFTYIPKYSNASDLVAALKGLYSSTPDTMISTKALSPEKPSHLSAKQQSAVMSEKQTESSLVISGLKISADDKRNILLILGSPAVYRNILNYLEKLDVPPKQVLLEATIAELTLKDDLKYGLEWFVKNKMAGGQNTTQTLGKLGLATTTGLAYQFVTDTQKFQMAINAFALENKINILSKPRIMVIDNHEATINIGTEVPIVSGEVTAADVARTDTQPSILRNIQYRTTGVLLRVLPTINSEGLLTLNISQEVSEAQTNPVSGIDSPIILIRKIDTLIVASNGQSIILGGIMSENTSTTVNKVPFLGNIPGLGYLFKSTSRGKTKTELMILLTPTIVTTTGDAAKLTREIKQDFTWFRD